VIINEQLTFCEKRGGRNKKLRGFDVK